MRLFPLFLILIIMLPAMEVYLIFSWVGESPVWALSYLAMTMSAGVICVKLAKLGMREFRQRGASIMQSGVIRYFVTFGKLWVIGILLFFPGYITDIIAVIIWLFIRGHSDKDSSDTKKPTNIIETSAQVVDDQDDRIG